MKESMCIGGSPLSGQNKYSMPIILLLGSVYSPIVKFDDLPASS